MINFISCDQLEVGGSDSDYKVIMTEEEFYSDNIENVNGNGSLLSSNKNFRVFIDFDNEFGGGEDTPMVYSIEDNEYYEVVFEEGGSYDLR
jgi:hypothetical protein|tara:strand:+ start:629 stop:901 length:273 start_codon:yes stop_codon:yes gene_type:complete